MRSILCLAINIITLLLNLCEKGGVKGIVAENLILKQQLLIVSRARQRAPTLKPYERCLLGWLAMVMNPGRIAKSAIIIKPATLFAFHRALVKKKYQRLYGSVCKNKPGPIGPRDELVKLVLKIKRRNPSYGCPKIALLISNRFDIDINKDVVRRILALHYYPKPPDFRHPSWLSLIGNMKDSLWRIDLFRWESMTLNSYWVLVVMDQWSRKIIDSGFMRVL